MSRTLTIAALALASALAPTPAAADDRAVAVIVAGRADVSNDAAAALAAELEKSLTTSGYQVALWSDNRARVGEVSVDCMRQSECIARTLQAASATDLLFMSFKASGDVIEVDLWWANKGIPSAEPRPRVSITSVDEAQAQFAQVSKRLIPSAVKTPATAASSAKASLGTTFWVSAALGGGALLTAGALGLYTRSRYGNCEDDLAAGNACGAGELDSIDRTALAGDIALLGAIAALSTAAVIFVLHDDDPESLQISAFAGPTGAHVGLSGRF